MRVDEAALHEPALVEAAAAMARLAVDNERLHAEVRSQLVQLRQASARLISAGDEARQRIERDLHDGAQQRLLALAMTFGRARSRLAGHGNPEIDAFLDTATSDIHEAVAELRELARGIHPVLLSQQGLAAALRALADRAPIPIELDLPADRLPAQVEATIYFLVSEAVTNAARHSRATHMKVALSVCDEGNTVVVLVSDNGVGGATVETAGGAGLSNIRSRVIAVGGELTVVSPAAVGTTITASLPCG